jgi:hypothetical protein
VISGALEFFGGEVLRPEQRIRNEQEADDKEQVFHGRGDERLINTTGQAFAGTNTVSRLVNLPQARCYLVAGGFGVELAGASVGTRRRIRPGPSTAM